MKMVSWNVNGLRACIQKGFLDYFNQINADFFCLQETKLSEGQLTLDLPGYEQYWSYAEKKGYSGTAIFTKHTPTSVHYGLDIPELDNEGRLITLEYPEFYLVTCYTPNAQRGLARIEYRLRWDAAFRAYLQKLDARKPVILCGDLNVAHQEIDLKNPKSNRGNAGFSDEERQSFAATLDAGFTDTFRHLHPDAKDCYTWWSYMFKARENNAGWRIDYFLVSDRIGQSVYQAQIHSDILGSDHCPVSIDLDLTCNGGIWSPMSEGEATQTFPIPNEPRTSAVTTKALVSLSAIFILILCVSLLWQPIASLLPTEPTQPDVTYLSEPPFSVHVLGDDVTWFDLDFYISSFSKYSVASEYDCLSDGSSLFFIDPVPHVATVTSNIALRVELNDVGYAHGMDQTECTFTFENAMFTISSESDLSISSSISIPTLEHTLVIPYYTNHSRTKLSGWIILGRLSSEASIRMSACWGDAVAIYPTLQLIPNKIFSDNIPLFEEGIIAQSCFLPVEEFEVYGAYAFGIPSWTAGHKQYYTNTITEFPTLDANYWLDIQLSDAVLSQIPADMLTLTVTGFDIDPVLSSESIADDPPYFSVVPKYSDQECTKFSGWLVYGNHAVNAVDLIVTYDDILICQVTTLVFPYLRAKDTALLTTESLLDYVVNFPETDIVLNLGQDTMSLIRQTIPALDVLLDRSDAIDVLMNDSTNGDSYRETLIDYFLSECLMDRMTAHQQAQYLLNLHPSCPRNPYNSVSIHVDAAACTTDELVDMLVDDELLYQAISLANSDATKVQIYLLAAPRSSYLFELVGRDDAYYILQDRLLSDPYVLEYYVLWPQLSSLFFEYTIPA